MNDNNRLIGQYAFDNALAIILYIRYDGNKGHEKLNHFYYATTLRLASDKAKVPFSDGLRQKKFMEILILQYTNSKSLIHTVETK